MRSTLQNAVGAFNPTPATSNPLSPVHRYHKAVKTGRCLKIERAGIGLVFPKAASNHSFVEDPKLVLAVFQDFPLCRKGFPDIYMPAHVEKFITLRKTL
jgi:hypothetical protein